MDLTLEQLVYSQQKNREYIWDQAKYEFMEVFGRYNRISGEEDEWLDERYKELCLKANITPW